MTSPLRSTALLAAFEDTRPASYWSTATVVPAQPLPQDAWLIELPTLDPPPAPARPGRERAAPLWLRVVGLLAAVLLAVLALGLAAAVLDVQRADGLVAHAPRA